MNSRRTAPTLPSALMLVALPWAGGCDSPELDFGRADAGGGWSAASEADVGGDGDGGGGTGGDGGSDGSSGAGGAGGAGDQGSAAGQSGQTADAGSGELHIGLDAEGFPAEPGQQTAGCRSGHSIAEVCGNALDDDCDGTVDEQVLLGRPCTPTCADGVGTMACNLVDHTLICITEDLQACRHAGGDSIVIACGNGMVDRGEWCDPAAPGEIEGETCTVDCRLPLFARCVFRSTVEPDVCEGFRRCDEWIGACLPYIDPVGNPRCPQVPVEKMPVAREPPPIEDGTEEYYLMAEVDGTCRITCSDASQCPSSLPVCYMSYCAVDL